MVSDTVEEGGGFSAVVRALEYSRTVYKNILRMVSYLTTSQLARIFAVFGALLLGVTALTPMQLIFGGLIVDLAAMIASAFSRPPRSVLSLRDNTEQALSKPFTVNLRAVLFAMFQAATVLAMHPIMGLLGFTFTPEQFSTAVFIAFTVCQFITFAELASERSIFRSGMRISLSFVLFFAGIAGFIALALLVPSVGDVFDTVMITPPLAIGCLVSAALTLAVNEIYKLIAGQDKK